VAGGQRPAVGDGLARPTTGQGTDNDRPPPVGYRLARWAGTATDPGRVGSAPGRWAWWTLTTACRPRYADIDAPDRVLYGLTVRQVAILAATAALLWVAYRLLTPLVGPAAVGIAAVPIATVAAGLALGRRDGISMDRWVAAAVATARAPRLLVAAAQPVPPVPAWAPELRQSDVTDAGAAGSTRTRHHGHRCPCRAPVNSCATICPGA
jgi:PrgI family protein